MKIKGVNSVIAELRAKSKDIDVLIDAETEAIAIQIENDAKQRAPKNLGDLARSISHEKVSDSNYKVTVNEIYGVYMEFGTGAKVSVPPEFAEMASTFKGQKNGTFADFIKSMTLYFEQKGYDTKNVWIACINILNNGINPQPFLYPAWQKGKKDYLTNLKRLLNKK